MSLSVAALRLATVKSLDDATTAGTRVFDSVVDPRDLLGAEPQPAIVIYTDTGRRRVEAREFLLGEASVDLTVELFVANASVVTHPANEGGDGGAQFEISYPATDAGYENRLRRLAYEIESILFGATGTWPELWRRCAARFADSHSEWDRGADSKDGSRFNFLRLIYRLEPVNDPVRGFAPQSGSFWFDFLAACDADQELDDIGKDWRALISTPTLAAWRAAMAEDGLTLLENRALGSAPVFPTENDTVPAAAEISVTDDTGVLAVSPAGATFTPAGGAAVTVPDA